ncbi:MAG TPA: TIGR01777 family oxidoreductase [Thermoleophilaceae bacterium]|nr:TIGR01777 family oxidoreductase [Thermoleophilaceae bacterium]
MSRVTVTGGTGLIGRHVVEALRARGDEVTVLSRSAAGTTRWPDPTAAPPPPEALAGRDGVIHLLGENVAQRWTAKARQAIRESRELGTRRLVEGVAALDPGERPRALVSMSAIGRYGARGDERVDESEPAGDDFLAQVVVAWETEARRASELGVRVAIARTGVVLAPGGGALDKMLPPFRMGVGGPVAGGRQFVPWVHLDDVVGALLFLLDSGDGTYNVTAPEPVTNRELSKALGRALRRPAVLPVPALAIRALYGEMAWIVTTGVRAVPKRLTEAGYEFKRPDLDDALRAATGV